MTKKTNAFRTALFGFSIWIAGNIYAYNPPAGAESAAEFASPLLLGGTGGASGSPLEAALPGDLWINPALSAGEQRVLLDVSYAGLYGAQDERGYGNAVNLGAVVPTSFAVFGGSLNFLQSPFDALLPLGTSLGVNFTVSKDLTERFYTGIGVSARMGSGRAGVSASLGALYHFGDLAFLRDFRLGVSVTGLGTAFRPDGVAGIRGGTEDADGFPGAFTLHTGLSFLAVDNGMLKAGFSAGASFPSFQNTVLRVGAEAEIRELVFAKAGWTCNFAELAEDCASLMPSVSLGVRLKIGSAAAGKLTDRQDWMESELTPSAGYKYFDGGIHAFSAGATLRLGQEDESGPEIEILLPGGNPETERVAF